jgi:hypothetical protein
MEGVYVAMWERNCCAYDVLASQTCTTPDQTVLDSVSCCANGGGAVSYRFRTAKVVRIAALMWECQFIHYDFRSMFSRTCKDMYKSNMAGSCICVVHPWWMVTYVIADATPHTGPKPFNARVGDYTSKFEGTKLHNIEDFRIATRTSKSLQHTQACTHKWTCHINHSTAKQLKLLLSTIYQSRCSDFHTNPHTSSLWQSYGAPQAYLSVIRYISVYKK